MTTLFKKLSDAYQNEGTTLLNTFQLIPAAMSEIKKFKENGNQIKFVKDKNLWYADFENWPLDRSHLLMVRGADKLLDELSQGRSHVTLKVSQHASRIKVHSHEALLELIQKDPGGFSGTYKIHGNYRTKELWLCPVVNFIFLKVPKFIKFQVV